MQYSYQYKRYRLPSRTFLLKPEAYKVAGTDGARHQVVAQCLYIHYTQHHVSATYPDHLLRVTV